MGTMSAVSPWGWGPRIQGPRGDGVNNTRGHRSVHFGICCSLSPSTLWRKCNMADILLYWQEKANTWPNLSAVARGLLCVPAMSTSSERSFSLAGRTLEDRRNMLAADSVDGLLFLHGDLIRLSVIFLDPWHLSSCMVHWCVLYCIWIVTH